MATTIGTAWINIKPSLDGVQSSIQKQLKGTGSSVGNEFSDEMAKSMTKSTAIGVALGNVIYDGVKKALSAVKELIDDAFGYSNQITASSKVLKSMGFAAEDITKATNKLQKSLKRLPTSTAKAVKGTQQLAASWNDLEFSTDAFMAFNAAILYGGGTVENLENAITQLSQVALDGPLDAQTWLSLRNSGLLPAAQAVAELNGMTVNDLKEALGKGQITTRQFMQSLIDIENETGKFSKGAEAANKTISGAWAVLRKNVTEKAGDIINKIGLQSGLTGAIETLGNKVTEFLGKADEFVDWLKEGGKDAEIFKKAIEGIGAALAASLGVGAIKGIVGAIGANGGLLAVLGTIGTKAAAVFGGLPGLLAGAIVGMGVAIHNFSSEIENFLMVDLPNWFNNTFNGLSQWGANVGEAFGRFGYQVTEKFKRAGEDIKMMWTDVKAFFASVPQWFSDRFTEARNGITSAFQNIGQWFGDRANDIKSFFVGIPQWFKDRFTDAKNGIKESWSKIGDWFGQRWEDIKRFFSWENLTQLGKDIINGIVSGMKGVIDGAGNWFKNIGSNMMNGIKKFFGIQSPSKLMRDEVGKFISSGIADGILKGEDDVLSAMTKVGNDALAQVAGIDSQLSEGISSAVTANAELTTDEEGAARVVQNNVFNVSDNFDLLKVSSELGYAVAMA